MALGQAAQPPGPRPSSPPARTLEHSHSAASGHHIPLRPQLTDARRLLHSWELNPGPENPHQTELAGGDLANRSKQSLSQSRSRGALRPYQAGSGARLACAQSGSLAPWARSPPAAKRDAPAQHPALASAHGLGSARWRDSWAIDGGGYIDRDQPAAAAAHLHACHGKVGDALR